jgi:chromosome partitioning protein
VTTVALAEFLAEYNNKVLVIDIDPQTNATVSLISQADWKKKNDAGETLAQLFLDKLGGTEKFDMGQTVVHKVSNLHGGIEGLDLLPSSLDLVDVQDKLPLIPVSSDYKGNPVTVLDEVISPYLKRNKYDYVLIDCPPNLGLITQNALKISDSYLVPVIPDILSTLGIPQILDRVRRFEKKWQTSIEPLGILLSKVRGIGLHRAMTAELKGKAAAGTYPPVWDTEIAEASRFAEAMDFDLKPRTLKAKYGYGGYYKVYSDLMDEFLKRCPAEKS